eukprot:CAMPEP_0201485230 /NCGR_PEP_ID=MMETSP0151_2-20130828/9356_1 /ASSEMBLY_ACC=CAM_ASM_000257 /TAXON_ID=200890 /ORGANISM="Paramoeba atlantica, Strain 621/1 / CCAP 1560/9" /LENGTH=72 /DNA_ID=CAMNT_0047869265 /DNA_START=215 /DNA_END=430 /DNA_ORIENTATION=+
MDGGSSGSGVFNVHCQLVGTLYGYCYSGSADLCDFNDYSQIDGSFYHAFDDGDFDDHVDTPSPTPTPTPTPT